MISAARLLILTAMGLAIGTIACTDADEVTGKSPGGTLLIESERDTTVEVDTLIVGDEDWLFAKGADTTAVTTWTVADTSIIRIIDQEFARVHIKALKVGTTTITAEHDGETGTLQIVVRDMVPADTMPRVEITLVLDSMIIGDSLPFGFNVMRRGEFLYWPVTLTLSDSSIVRLIPMGSDSRGYWIEGVKLGSTVLAVRCGDCIADSLTIRVREPPPVLPDPRASRYEAIDLGTVGGASAFPLALNDSGDVVGYSLTAAGEQHAFLWTNGVMQDLSPSGAHSAAQVVTNSRVIAGTSVIDGVVHVIRWENGQSTDLGPPGGTADRQGGVVGISATDVVAWGEAGSAIWHNGVKQFLSGFRARAMNSRHQIAGSIGDRPYLWDDGLLIPLAIPDVPSHAVDINSDGVVLGDTPQWTSSWGIRPTITVWVGGRISETFGHINPVAINDARDVVGELAGSAAFYGHDGMWMSMPSWGQGGTLPHDLNNLAMVVGESWTVGKTQHAFVWQVSDSTPVDLGTGPITADRMGSSAIAINARGDIVGWVAPCTTPAGRCTELDQSRARAVLWRLKNP